MTIERDEADELPGEAGDPLRLAIGQLILVVMELSTSEPQRSRAVTEAMAAEGRIRAALQRPRFNN